MDYAPKYTITPRLAGLLEKIAELRTKVELSPISVQWMPRLERDAFARLAHTSTAIEGNPLTLRDVEILSQGVAPCRRSSHPIRQWMKPSIRRRTDILCVVLIGITPTPMFTTPLPAGKTQP